MSTEPSLESMSSGGLRAKPDRRERAVERLRLRREQVAGQLAEIEAELELIAPRPIPPGVARAAPGGIGRGPRIPRAARGSGNSLVDVLLSVVPPGRVLTPAEARELVLEAGYVSSAKTFGQVVAAALARDPHFERLGRGSYRRTQ